METNKKYGLFTSITMIMGIVVGSGIFFKVDDILVYTNGSVWLGIGVFLVAAIAIIFGSLSVAQLATRTDKPGGIISYAEEFVNKETAAAFGWFQTFLYIPSLIAIVSWVSGIYIKQLFGIESTWLNEYTIGLIVLIYCFVANVISTKYGGYFQNVSMIIKLIPLLVFAVFGLIKGDTASILSQDMETIKSTGVSLSILSAFAPIAFSFDGWIIATSICNEIKNSKRNLPLAMIISPLVVLVAYIIYFVGMSTFVGPEKVIELGDDSVNHMASILFGEMGAKLMLIFVIIAVVGTLNGLTMAIMRMPYSLAIRKMIPKDDKLSVLSEKGVPVNSAILGFVLGIIWFGINYATQKAGIKGDVSEISICVSYINYCVLYVAIIRLARKGEIKSKVKGYFIPIMAIIGALIILTGGISVAFIYYVIICFSIMGAGYLYYKNTSKK